MLALPAAARHLGWFAIVCLVAFGVPYLGVSVLALHRDFFYLVHLIVTIGLVASYVRVEHVDAAELFRRRSGASLGIGAILAAFLVLNVLRSEPATEHPGGAYFTFELLWRGVAYGLVDTLLLTIFPCLIAYELMQGQLAGLRGRLRFTALTLPLVLVITATYHWGYPQYREDGLSRPEIGNVLISIPALATTNPVGSLVAHVAARRRRDPRIPVADLQPASRLEEIASYRSVASMLQFLHEGRDRGDVGGGKRYGAAGLREDEIEMIDVVGHGPHLAEHPALMADDCEAVVDISRGNVEDNGRARRQPGRQDEAVLPRDDAIVLRRAERLGAGVRERRNRQQERGDRSNQGEREPILPQRVTRRTHRRLRQPIAQLIGAKKDDRGDCDGSHE
jgi:hypothetical protein